MDIFPYLFHKTVRDIGIAFTEETGDLEDDPLFFGQLFIDAQFLNEMIVLLFHSIELVPFSKKFLHLYGIRFHEDDLF